MVKKNKEPKIQAPTPNKVRYNKDMWQLIATCPYCNVLLQKDEPYKIGWTKVMPDGGQLSIRGHRFCVTEFYRQKESNNGKTTKSTT